MDAPRYRDYMKGLDAAAERWQKQIGSLDIEKMKLDYTEGKRVEIVRREALEELKGLHGLIEQQRAGQGLQTEELLSTDIMIENAVGDFSVSLGLLLDVLPSSDEGSYWERALTPMMQEISDRKLALRGHIAAYADKLQSKAQSCSK